MRSTADRGSAHLVIMSFCYGFASPYGGCSSVFLGLGAVVMRLRTVDVAVSLLAVALVAAADLRLVLR